MHSVHLYTLRDHPARAILNPLAMSIAGMSVWRKEYRAYRRYLNKYEARTMILGRLVASGAIETRGPR